MGHEQQFEFLTDFEPYAQITEPTKDEPYLIDHVCTQKILPPEMY
jgi:hypothetical protein